MRHVTALFAITIVYAAAPLAHANPGDPEAAQLPQPPATESARSDEASCTTTTTTTTTCRGSAAPLAAPGPELPPPAPTTPQLYAPPLGYYAPAPYYMPQMKTHIEERPRYSLVITGLAVWGGVYLWNVFGAMVADDWRPALPIVGPLIMMGDKHLDGLQGLFLFDALAQATGAILLIAGAVSKTHVTVYEKVAIVPSVTPNGAGLAAMGHF